MSHFRITGAFKTMSPLSHISENISTVTYLVEEPIIQPDGSIENVFCYNGNAWRGQLRDLSAMSMMNMLGCKATLDTFHLLFSGGKIGGEQSVDIGQAREIRKLVPMVALFGGGIGNQILPGKMRVGNSYPVCREAASVLPDEFSSTPTTSYSEMTFEKSFTRMDDSKHPDAGDIADIPAEDDKKKKESGDVSTQMRMTSELLCAGVTLVHEIDLIGVSEIELGVIADALSWFGMSPFIGGQGTRGHGKVEYVSTLKDMRTGEQVDFVRIEGGNSAILSNPAVEALSAYKEHLRVAKESGAIDKFMSSGK